jgi:hypothetical protein
MIDFPVKLAIPESVISGIVGDMNSIGLEPGNMTFTWLGGEASKDFYSVQSDPINFGLTLEFDGEELINWTTTNEYCPSESAKFVRVNRAGITGVVTGQHEIERPTNPAVHPTVAIEADVCA